MKKISELYLIHKIKSQTDKIFSLIRVPKAPSVFAKPFTTWGAFGVFELHTALPIILIM